MSGASGGGAGGGAVGGVVGAVWVGGSWGGAGEATVQHPRAHAPYAVSYRFGNLCQLALSRFMSS